MLINSIWHRYLNNNYGTGSSQNRPTLPSCWAFQKSFYGSGDRHLMGNSSTTIVDHLILGFSTSMVCPTHLILKLPVLFIAIIEMMLHIQFWIFLFLFLYGQCKLWCSWLGSHWCYVSSWLARWDAKDHVWLVVSCRWQTWPVLLLQRVPALPFIHSGFSILALSGIFLSRSIMASTDLERVCSELTTTNAEN